MQGSWKPGWAAEKSLMGTHLRHSVLDVSCLGKRLGFRVWVPVGTPKPSLELPEVPRSATPGVSRAFRPRCPNTHGIPGSSASLEVLLRRSGPAV